jgi:peptidoglycan/xylan/chitin deacetylase (PgdA/CDA1 family)
MNPVARSVPVLMYHHVSPAPGLITVSPQNFRAQMAWLAREGWRSIGCDDLARYLQGEPLPDRSVLITFDDGYLDNWVHAAPILAEHGQRATIFLITGRIGDGPPRPQAPAPDAPACPDHNACKARIAADDADSVMLRWSEVDALRMAGTCEFHSHTHTHLRWDKSEADPGVRDQRMAEDLAHSRDALAQRLGQPTRHLCWPQGFYDRSYIATARALGFDHLYTTEPGCVTRGSDPGQLPRLVVKDKGEQWFASRMRLYRHPLLTRLYHRLKV